MANSQRECFVREVTKLACSFNEILDMVEIVGVLEMLKFRLLSEGTSQKKNCRK
jgi:hypothetical protein